MFLAQTSCIMFAPHYYAIVLVAGMGFEPMSVPYDGLLLMKLLYNFLDGNRALFNYATTTPTRNVIFFFERMVGLEPTTHGLSVERTCCWLPVQETLHNDALPSELHPLPCNGCGARTRSVSSNSTVTVNPKHSILRIIENRILPHTIASGARPICTEGGATFANTIARYCAGTTHL